MSNESTEIRLVREIHLWRSLLILLLLINVGTMVLSYILDMRQHASDNTARAAAWTEIRGGILKNWEAIQTNQDRMRLMILKNYEAILRNDEHLRQCSGCHSHPQTHRK